MWNKFKIRLVAMAALSVCIAGEASAYIDPGTGMSFVSGIGAFIAGIFAVAFGAIAMTFKRWSAAIKALLSKSKAGGN